ncbi:hypothetical protein Mal15_19070 [Stieleria maiorica]|uniref:Uncharacterized protein n=1 Tax=Stieleria maiorica TaxID=2795974 RepID=A0A5B9M9E0_9BACT|nr:hypothetical protein [Stieleria maiorica]QEF97861.1 hypothetical protein Mal15_19070 [Stieleria maiorica]
MSKGENRITIIPAIHGKLTSDRKASEPDVAWIVQKWLERHPEVENRRGRIRAVSGQWTTEDGLKTEVITITMNIDDDIAGYDPEQDADLYEYWRAEPRYFEAS